MIKGAIVRKTLSRNNDQMEVWSVYLSRRDHDSFRTGVEMNFGRIEHLKFEFEFIYVSSPIGILYWK